MILIPSCMIADAKRDEVSNVDTIDWQCIEYSCINSDAIFGYSQVQLFRVITLTSKARVLISATKFTEHYCSKNCIG